MKKKSTAIANRTAQQGDVLLRKLDAMPEGTPSKITRNQRLVLAHGESGHSHIIEDTEAELIELGERMLLRLGKAATIVHEEHKPITLSPGIWDVGRVREYDYFQRMTRQVVD